MMREDRPILGPVCVRRRERECGREGRNGVSEREREGVGG